MINTQLINSDCLAAMKNMADNSVDSIVTDPPYGLSFMGRKWDYDVPSKEIWVEALRVLKPGGHLLSFSGSRTYHRMVINIEDAGFEIRDQIMWIYGSGFPKSMNISKAIDKAAGVEQEVIGIGRSGAPETHSSSYNMSKGGSQQMGGEYEITKPTTSEAEQWDGWGTALKPANEPICLARKPIKEKTIAANVIEHGTGGINIDGCRIGGEGGTSRIDGSNAGKERNKLHGGNFGVQDIGKGRFPPNVILTHHPECIHEGFKEVKSNAHWAKIKVTGYGSNLAGDKGSITYEGVGEKKKSELVENWKCHPECPIKILDEQTDGGAASRFFYCAKASKAERNKGLEKNNHPTVKPVSLMQYLCRLITPKNGTVLDPFMGSGTTGIAANLEGFNFIGIEMEEEYVEIARARISHSGDYTIAEDLVMKRIEQPTLFDFAV